MNKLWLLIASSILVSCSGDGSEPSLDHSSSQERPASEGRAASQLVTPMVGTATKIMPLGDSITYGVGSSTGSSYRAELWQRMVGLAGYPIDFVGSQQSGQLPDTDNEGHSGWRIDQIAASIDGWLATYQPNIVLLHIGTNDCNQNYNVATAPDRLQALIDQIIKDDPGATVVVAQIVPSTDATINGCVVNYNAAIPGIVQNEVSQGKRVKMVDLYHALSNADMNDTLHPNDAGYAKMASLWYAALERILGDGRDWPHFVSGLENGETAPTWLDTVEASQNVGGYPCCGLTHMESSPRNETAHGALSALMYSGSDNSAAGPSYSYNRVFDVNVPVSADTVLSYWIYPQQLNGTFVAIDFAFTDGSDLRDSGVVDQWGARVHPQFQGEGGHLVQNQWNQVRANLGALAGKVIDRIHIGYDQPANTGAFRGYVDDIRIVDTGKPALVGNDLALKTSAAGTAPCVAAESAANAVDGTVAGNSKWCSAAGDRSLQIDLGRTVNTSRIVVRHAGAGGESVAYNSRDFTLAVSTDGSTFTNVAQVTGNVDSVTTHDFTATAARYVRLTVTTPTQGTDPAARIYEVEVY